MTPHAELNSRISRQIKLSWIIALTFLLGFGCDTHEYRRPEIGLEYFPLQTGLYSIYSVETTEYAQGQIPAHTNYEILVEVVDSFPSTSSEITYVIHRSKRLSPAENWQVLDTWSARKNSRELILSEGNIPYVKLVFPLREGSQWNGNKYNSAGNDEYELVNVGKPFQIAGNVTSESPTVTVVQHDDPDPIRFFDQRKEVYAKGIGLIYREIIQHHFCDDDGCRGQGIIEEGIDYRQALKEHGIVR